MKYKETQKERCMVIQMNKTGFIKKLSEVTGYSKDTCEKINEVLEDNFLIGKKNKVKIVSGLKEKLNLKEEDADKLYETCMDIISKELKEKIKHPFKDKD